jgi:putative FmdB family regulatory protein
MPTYEYECQKCGRTFEEFQSITADPLTECRQKSCRGKVKRLIGGGGGLLFKGSGFYITDYRSDGYKQAEKAAKESSPSSDKPDKSDGKASSSGNADSRGGKKKASRED